MSEFESLPEVAGRPSLTTFIRRVRIHSVPNTIVVHENDVNAVVAYPFGMAWRRAAGRRWCPYCLSLSPMDLIEALDGIAFWDMPAAQAEMRKLIESNEMDGTVENMTAMGRPSPGSAYGIYNCDAETGEPMSMIIAFSNYRMAFNLLHMIDLRPNSLRILVSHLNRIAPFILWSVDHDGDLNWQRVGIAIVSDADDEPE